MVLQSREDVACSRPCSGFVKLDLLLADHVLREEAHPAHVKADRDEL